MGLGGGLLEALHLRLRDIASEPHQAVLTLGGVADGGALGGVLGLEHLVVDAGQVLGGLGQEGLAAAKPLVAVVPLTPQLTRTLIGDRELGDGVGPRQGTDGGQGGHFPHRGQADDLHVRVRRKGGHGLFIRPVDVDVEALVLQLPQLLRGEIAPLGQLLRRRTGGGFLLLQGLAALQAVGQLLIKRLKVLVGHGRGLPARAGVLLQGHVHPGQLREALQMPLVGAGLFGEVDDAQGPQPVQQGGFFRCGRHNVDDLHFFDHPLTSCSFFLAILPRTTAEVCWSPR